jgi:hypothetical protein
VRRGEDVGEQGLREEQGAEGVDREGFLERGQSYGGEGVGFLGRGNAWEVSILPNNVRAKLGSLDIDRVELPAMLRRRSMGWSATFCLKARMSSGEAMSSFMASQFRSLMAPSVLISAAMTL